ncbi:MAG: hypothetical protein KDE48_10140 [Anaerolineales bacterium]|nr:hypothetical protein [Anaerolineales bacterium]
MNRKRLFAGLLITILALTSCTIIYQLLLNGCIFWNCAPDRSFSVLDLDLPDSLFPESAEILPLSTLSELDGAIEAGANTVYWNEYQGRSVYDVRRYGTEKSASDFYIREVKNIVARYGEIPIDYTSQNADEYFTTCGYSDTGHRCWFVGRYQEFVIVFVVSINGEMSVDRFKEIVKYIDKQISDNLAG